MSFLQQMESDLARARADFAGGRFAAACDATLRYVGPASRSRDFLHLHAQALQSLNRLAEADTYFQRLHEIDPNSWDAIAQRADGLSAIGEGRRALEIIEDARSRNPGHIGLLWRHLNALIILEGAGPALQRLYQEADARGSTGGLETAIENFRQKALSLFDADEIERLDDRNMLGLKPIEATDGYSLKTIYESFESIGDDCQFGFVQRRRNAEPLSLLRWTSVSPHNLIRLLENDFDGYDDPEHYALRGQDSREYFLYESAYDTESHTGVNRGDISPEDFLLKMTRRQVFLKRKLLADLKAGEKTFLYKSDDEIPDDIASSIEENLLRLGAKRCLFVSSTDDPAKIGTVEVRSDSRYTGYVSRKPVFEKLNEWDRVVVTLYDRLHRR